MLRDITFMHSEYHVQFHSRTFLDFNMKNLVHGTVGCERVCEKIVKQKISKI